MSMVNRVRVASESDATTSYVVTFVVDQAVACTCPHFHHRSVTQEEFECKHMRNAALVAPLSRLEMIQIRSILARNS